MAEIKIRENENIEGALKRFKKIVEDEGILKKWKENQFFVKPSTRSLLLEST